MTLLHTGTHCFTSQLLCHSSVYELLSASLECACKTPSGKAQSSKHNSRLVERHRGHTIHLKRDLPTAPNTTAIEPVSLRPDRFSYQHPIC